MQINLANNIHQDGLSQKGINTFRRLIYDHYAQNRRSFSWRETHDPYHTIVSEIMLQQTQTERVKIKFEQFITTFPTLESLAHSARSDVIGAWQGLGYNRRALALHQLAQSIMDASGEFKGIIPGDPALLQTFKGIGPHTAASICAFAFNKPTIFIETNIRTVFIHCFFPSRTEVKDAEIIPLVEQTLDTENPRDWYYALMDYGVMLKKSHKNPSRKSAHHTVQSKFEGSDRQVRGLILKFLVETPLLPEEFFFESINREPDKIKGILSDLKREGFITRHKRGYQLAK